MPPVSSMLHLNDSSEFGRIIYTMAILLMFAAVILLLMVRTIRRENTEFEMENLLDAMRFREELDLERRRKRRLLKTKRRVSAWLMKTHANESQKYWHSSPQLIVSNSTTVRSTSYIPEIVVTPNSEDALSIANMCRSRTPSLSLMFDFGNPSRKTPRSAQSELNLSRDLSNLDFVEQPVINVKPNVTVTFDTSLRHSSLHTVDYQRSDSDSISSTSC